MSEEGSVVNNKFRKMFICHFRESLQCRIHTQNDSGQLTWTPNQVSPKNDQEMNFL